MARAKSTTGRLVRLALLVLATAAVFALALVALRQWVKTDSGRALIVNLVDGRRVGPLGNLRIEGLKGDIFSDATITNLNFVDDNGVWLRAQNARVVWSPRAVFDRSIDIASIDITRAEVLRRPKVTPQPRRDNPFDFGVRLTQARVRELRLLDGVIGPPASYTLAGAFTQARGGGGFFSLNLAPLSGPADRIDAEGEWITDGPIQLTADAQGPSGGLIASLMQSPEGEPVTIALKAQGRFPDLTASASAKFGDTPIVDLKLQREGAIAQLAGEIAVDKWPLLDVIARRTGGPITVDGSARLSELSSARVTLHANAPAGRINLASVVDLTRPALPDTIHITATDYDMARLSEDIKGRLTAEGDARITSPRMWSWRGATLVADFEAPGVVVRTLSGPAAISMDQSSIVFDVLDASATGARLTSTEGSKPQDLKLTVSGSYNTTTEIVELVRTRITGAAGDVTARGDYRVSTGALKLAGSADIARLQDFSAIKGSARGQWTLARASETAPWRIGLDARGSGIASDSSALGQLLGSSPNIKASLLYNNGRFLVESGAVSGGALVLDVTGDRREGGEVSARASGRFVRGVSFAGVRVDAGSFTANLRGDLDRLTINANGRDLAGVVAGRAIRLDTLSYNGIAADRLSGDVELAGRYDNLPLRATMELSGTRDAPALENLRLRLADLRIEAPRLTFDDGVSGAVRLAGSLNGLYGVERGDITGNGVLIGRNGVQGFTLATDVRNFRRGDVVLATANLSASGNTDAADLTATVVGVNARSLNLKLAASARKQTDGWLGTARLSGIAASAQVATPEPVSWSSTSQGYALTGAVDSLGGRLKADIASGDVLSTASVELTSLDLEALTRLLKVAPYVGEISGKVDFRNAGGAATGGFSRSLKDANPRGVTSDPFSMDLTGGLSDRRVRLDLKGAGQGFQLLGNATTLVQVGDAFALSPSRAAPLTGKVSLEGRAEKLWALFGPEDQTLRGGVNLDLDIAGTLASPALNGVFRVRDGAYDHGETGLHLEQIVLQGDFNQKALEITQMTAVDRAGGRLSGDGRFQWNGSLTGGIDFSAIELHALQRSDRSAVVSGNGEISLESDAIRVSGDLTITEARISVEQPKSAQIPTLPNVRRVNFPRGFETDAKAEPTRPVRLDLDVSAPRRIVVFGRGLDTEWGGAVKVSGTVADPVVRGTVRIIRGDVSLAGRRFTFDTGTVTLDGPIRTAQINIAATRDSSDVDVSLHLTGSPTNPKFALESTPVLPQDEILSRVLFNRSAAQLSGLEAAQLAAALTELAGGQAAFYPADLLRGATGLDRFSIGAEGNTATVAAGKYISDDVYLELGAGGAGGVGAQVEWEPTDSVSVISSAQGNGDTRITVRWKKDY
jgi:translocation and assembly module TamB